MKMMYDMPPFQDWSPNVVRSLYAHVLGDDAFADVWRARAAEGVAAASIEPHT